MRFSWGEWLHSAGVSLQRITKQALQWVGSALNIVYLPALFLSIPLCVFWAFRLPTPGVAIGALGAAGVLVALKAEKVEPWHKFIWSIVTLLLLIIEVAAINDERASQFREHIHDLEEQRQAQAQTLLQIVLSSQAQMSQNQSQFEKTVLEMNETLGQITGGDTYIWLVPWRGPNPLTSFTVFLHGKYPFFAEHVEVYDSNGLHNPMAHISTFGVIASAPMRTYYPNFAYHLELSVPVTDETTQAFEFRIYGRTAFIQEFMQLYRTKSGWSISYQLHPRKGLAIKYADPGFPKDFRLQ